MIIIAICIVALIILCGVCAYGFLNQNKEVLKINDLNLEKDQYGIYNLKGHITPLKDFDYLEARVVIYDNNGVIIGKSSCAWNAAHVKKDDTLSVGNGLGTVCDGGTPAYAVISFFDNVYSEKELANFTVRMNDTAKDNSTSSNTGSSTPTSDKNNDSDKKFTKEDMELAKNKAYWDGYGDSIDDSLNYYDDYSSSSGSSVETTSDSSSHSSSSGSSSSSGGSGSSSSSSKSIMKCTIDQYFAKYIMIIE